MKFIAELISGYQDVDFFCDNNELLKHVAEAQQHQEHFKLKRGSGYREGIISEVIGHIKNMCTHLVLIASSK